MAEVHGHEKWPLPDQRGCTAVSMETDLQESWAWSCTKGLIWESAPGSGHSKQEEDGLQTGESCGAKAAIPCVPAGSGFPLSATGKRIFAYTCSVLFIHTAATPLKQQQSVVERFANPTFAVLLFSDAKLKTRCSFKRRI